MKLFEILSVVLYVVLISDAKDVVRPIIPIKSCIEEFAAPTVIDDFFSTAINGKSMANQ